MALKLEANFPNMAKGTELDIGGILVNNGSSVELSDDQEGAFVARHRKTLKDFAEGSEFVKVSGTGKIGAAQMKELFPDEEASGSVPLDEEAAAEPASEGSGN